MKRAVRRSFTWDGKVKQPGLCYEAELDGALGIRLSCVECYHQGEVPFSRIDPEMPVPDVGIGKTCSKCGCTEIESWPIWPSVVGRSR